MALETLQICLRAWAYGKITGANFFTMLGHTSDDEWQAVAGEIPSQTALIYFVDDQIFTYRDSPEPWELFNAEIEQRLLRAAAWLDSRGADVFERCRAAGLTTDVFIGGWIDQDQLDLHLPAPFLLACGRAGLSIDITTND